MSAVSSDDTECNILADEENTHTCDILEDEEDYWSIFGAFIYDCHAVSRGPPFAPEDSSFPVLLNDNVRRRTETDSDKCCGTHH